MGNDFASLPATELRPGFSIRPLQSGDSLESLTDLLHRGYRRLADMNLRFVATHQDVETTRRRALQGECFVLVHDGELVGTITLYPPGRCGGCEWYDQPHVASFGQFTVDPGLQASGLGSLMIEHVADRARALGARELALDTAEPAGHLVEFYQRRGFRIVGLAQWGETNYRSVIMSRRLED